MMSTEYDNMKAQKDQIVTREHDAIWNEALAACRAAIRKFTDYPSDCDCLGMIDPETGVAECSLESRGADCLCAVSMETAEKIAVAVNRLTRVAIASGEK